ncbi:MAG: GGDEF domain-containing protein, partial [Gemmatimonadota bacterium]|nr:GGDEF domain-containing protein [Gemmatimonadota bacterium]
ILEFLEALLDRIDGYGGACSRALIDGDFLKNYNDTLGHVAGDRVLRSLADVLRDELRVSDIAARYGGEEFSVIMVNSNRTEAGEAAERLRETIQRYPFPNEDIQPRGDLTVSIGIASYPQDADSYEELVGAADEALYEAKRRGKNQVRAA